MAKSKNGSTEASKQGSEGQKLGCRLGSDAAALLGSLEFMLQQSSGGVVPRALVALADSMSRKQIEAIEAMMRARGGSLSRLRKACGAPAPELSTDQSPAGAGQGPSNDRTEQINRIRDRAVDAPLTAALDVLYSGD